MKTDLRLGLFLMGRKGAAVLDRIGREHGREILSFVVTSGDPGLEEDGEKEIRSLAAEFDVPVYDRRDPFDVAEASHLFAVAWRWMIRNSENDSLVVFHDSLLPAYRGFAPIISSLIEGETKIGVTALLASEQYDRGQVIAQDSVKIRYPITIAEAISAILPCYETLASTLVATLHTSGKLEGEPQDESFATYSLWRDEEDYKIDWTQEAARIRRFIDAVGFPYRGASTTIDGTSYRVLSCREVPDVKIHNRDPGKVIFVEDDGPVVVCGTGLLQILEIRADDSKQNALPLPRFRVRFGS